MDYRTFESRQSIGGFQDDNQRRWWTLSPNEAADAISSTLALLKDSQGARLNQYVISARLYGNLLPPYSKLNGARERISYNVVQSGIDTITSKIAKNKPKPLFLTSGGDYEIQRKAKKLNKFIDGVFYENKAHDLGRLVFRDGCVYGDGLVKVFARNGRVAFERVSPDEIYVDEIEGQYGDPRQMHQVKQVDRAVLLDLFPGYRKIIEEAKDQAKVAQPSKVADMVTVRESWHLPSGPDAKDGKHIITIDGHALTPMEPWQKQFFPFARFQWCPRLFGYWSQGAAEQVQNIQIEINKLLWVIQRSFQMAGSFKVFLENGSKIVKEHLTNDIGAIVTYTGTKPEYYVPSIVPSEMFQHLLTLKGAAFEQLGVSMLSATSQKPAGLNSGKALREYNDIESDRFQTIGRAYEDFFLQLGRLSLAAVQDIAAEAGSYKVTVPSNKFIESVDWKDIDLDEEEFVMQCFPVSSLPNEPAGRLQSIQEMIQAGMIDPIQGRRLMNFPDLEQVEGLQNAQLEYLTGTLEKILDEEDFYAPPEPYDNLQLARELALEVYTWGKIHNLPSDRMEKLRLFISQVDVLQQAGTPGLPVPQANPTPTPQSDLIRNVPGVPGLQ